MTRNHKNLDTAELVGGIAPNHTSSAAEGPKGGHAGRSELAFLPAAQELVETPASPIGRGMVLAICGFFGLAVLWASIGEVDITASARGQIIADGRSKTIQPLEPGIVTAIHVRNGDLVAAGDPLIDLDPTDATADSSRLDIELAQARIEASRLTAQLAGAPSFETPDGLREMAGDQLRIQRDLLTSRLAEQKARLAAIASETRQREAEQAAIQAEIDRLQAILPMVRKRADAKMQLASKGAIPKLQAIEFEEHRIATEHELKAAKKRFEEVDAALVALNDRQNQMIAEFESRTLDERAATEARIAALEQEQSKAQARKSRMALKAPVDGRVQELAVTTIGGVVTQAQPLLTIVPSDQTLLVEALIENRDRGFVREGQRAEIKVDTFPFTKYGLIEGVIDTISADAVEQETSQGPIAGFTATIAMVDPSLMVDGNRVHLTPGMSVQADIKTGRRKLIDFILSPVMRHGQEALRER